MTNDEIEATRQRYIDSLTVLFFPDDPVSSDIVNYFASLLRIVGMEDKGWDPYAESRAVLEDLNAIMQIDLPEKEFANRELTIWRIGLLMYSHIVEMDGPYEVLTNLLRFRLGKGYSPNPYYMFLSSGQKKGFRRSGLSPRRKIEILKELSTQSGLVIGDLFDDFYKSSLRNAISHSDYILTDEEFRCRTGTGPVGAFGISLPELDRIITSAKVFISTFFGLETAARARWARQSNRAVPYDAVYKGLMEILKTEDNLMCGFKVHWPNNTESVYRRTEDGIEMSNCLLDVKHSRIEFMVGSYASEPGSFSPLVEKDGAPRYTPLENGVVPRWQL
jgi:hypothetical protein